VIEISMSRINLTNRRRNWLQVIMTNKRMKRKKMASKRIKKEKMMRKYNGMITQKRMKKNLMRSWRMPAIKTSHLIEMSSLKMMCKARSQMRYLKKQIQINKCRMPIQNQRRIQKS
jgi:hypothetical protein